MYLSIGVLCLMLAVAVGYHLGSLSAQATVFTEPSQDIVTLCDRYAVLSDGGVWLINPHTEPPSWQFEEHYSMPIPTEQVRFIDVDADRRFWMIDTSGNFWGHGITEPGWANYGPHPGFPVPTASGTWGGIKSQLGTDGN
jgi:hypothetical protein